MIRALKLGAQADFMINQIKAGIAPEQAERFIEQQERAREVGVAQTLNLGWMKVPTEWGIRVHARQEGPHRRHDQRQHLRRHPGRLAVPDRRCRAALTRSPACPAMGYSIYEKAELWSENAADLYEEAIQRRWRPSTDIPWETMEDLPDDVEKAVCQVCTWLCEKALLAGDIVGKWLPEMSYGYHEVKLYLSTSAVSTSRASSRCSASGRSPTAAAWACRPPATSTAP